MNRIASRANAILLLVLFLIAGLCFFLAEYAAQGKTWVSTSGSPHVYNGSNIGCGIITDANGVILLDMNGGRTYTEDLTLRKATLHWLGDRKGSILSPAISHYADKIAGYDLINGVYSYSGTGGTVTTALVAEAQVAALEALGNRKGTVAVMNYKTGELLCSVTTPTYDPDDIPDIDGDTTGKYEGAYLNRFTQSVYIPGSIFKVVTLIAALETIPDIEQQTFDCHKSYSIGGTEITCELNHGTKQTLQQAFTNSCNCAFAQIVEQLGGETLKSYVERLGVTQSVTFDGITTAQGNYDIEDASVASIAWSGIGQYKDTVNPCAYLTFVAALANGGTGVSPYLVKEIKVGNRTTYAAKTEEREAVVSADIAEKIGAYMRTNVQNKYGDKNFPDMTIAAKTGTAEVGADSKPNAMLVGFSQNSDFPVAFIACVENAGHGSTICVPIISSVLKALAAEFD